MLAYLVLSHRPPTRGQLATLLFNEAEDPLGAVRWGLSEIRRALGADTVVEGDPVVLRLPDDTVVDVDMIVKGAWADAIHLPGLGSELLEAHAMRGAPGFESWLLAEQRRVMAASEEVMHEAALASLTSSTPSARSADSTATPTPHGGSTSFGGSHPAPACGN